MAWGNGQAFRLWLPAFVDVLIRGKAFERFESLRDIIGHQEDLPRLLQVVTGFVVILFHGGLFERAMHAFRWAIRPGIGGCGQPMVNPRLTTDARKDLVKGIEIALPSGALDAVIGEHRVDLLG